ncbi:hypothetical protein B0I37DRAFT_387574 [Chaetomium sp. MPI-CAGE-AT-0009]|nr:hypothetical protein B0I37DRAFT_387574 [Chaetomium sp. MPI-CAGE-AT-0009]
MSSGRFMLLVLSTYIVTVLSFGFLLAAVQISYVVIRHITRVLPGFVHVVEASLRKFFPSLTFMAHFAIGVVCVLVIPLLLPLYILWLVILPLSLASIRISYMVVSHVIERLPAFVQVVKQAVWGSFHGMSVWSHAALFLISYTIAIKETEKTRHQVPWY